MKVKQLGSFFLAVVLSFSAMGCERAGSVPRKEKTSGSQPMTYEGEEVYTKDGQEVGLNEEINRDGCIWSVSSLEITKELGDRPQADFNYWGEEMDDAGNLTGSQSYVFVTVSCRNSSGSAREVLLNSNGLVAADERGQLLETGSEARYISKRQSGKEGAENAFHYRLEDGGETGWIELGYIIEDCFADDYEKLYYCVGTQGSLLGNPENRYIKVERDEKSTLEK